MHLLTHLINKSWISTQVGSADKHSCLNRYRCWNMSVIKCVGTKKKLWKRKENNSSYHRPLPSKGWSGCGVSNLKTVGQRGQPLEVFYCTQYEPTVVRSYYRFFFMGKMVIWFILSKIFHIFHFLYRTIPFYIFDNTLIILIRSLNTTVWQLKKQSYRINLNRQILTYKSFSITYESFSTGRTCRIVYRKTSGFFYHVWDRGNKTWLPPPIKKKIHLMTWLSFIKLFLL
jgi:hypothetical protein